MGAGGQHTEAAPATSAVEWGIKTNAAIRAEGQGAEINVSLAAAGGW